MIWIWITVAFFAGFALGVFLVGLLQANGRTTEDDQEQMEYLRTWRQQRHPDDLGADW